MLAKKEDYYGELSRGFNNTYTSIDKLGIPTVLHLELSTVLYMLGTANLSIQIGKRSHYVALRVNYFGDRKFSPELELFLKENGLDYVHCGSIDRNTGCSYLLFIWFEKKPVGTRMEHLLRVYKKGSQNLVLSQQYIEMPDATEAVEMLFDGLCKHFLDYQSNL